MSVRHIVGVTSVALTVAAASLPDTYFLETLRRMRAKYNIDEEEEPVPANLRKRFQDVMDDLSLDEDKKSSLRSFHVFGYNMYHAGSVYSKYGAVVGIPMYFRHKTVEDINPETAFLYNASVDWDRPAAQGFVKTLTLSENAQKFALAREILKIKETDPMYRTLSALMHVLVSLVVYDWIRRRTRFSERSKMFRGMINLGVTVAAIATYIATDDMLSYETDVKIDQLLSTISPDYIQGGHEFYDKELKRNVALRTLLGKDGKKLFTANGNEVHFLRQKSAPLFSRKTFFDSKLQNIEELV